MSRRATVWRAAEELARSGAGGALSTVSRHLGSLPMAHDAKLAVAPDGRRWGTIGGGCTEAEVAEQALAAARTGQPGVARHTLNADLAGDLGLSCGGTAEFFLEPVATLPEMAELYGSVADAIERRVPAHVYTPTDWSAGPAKLVVIGQTRIVVGKVPAAIADTELPVPQRAGIDEELEMFVEPVPRLPRVIVFGAGHVGKEIASLAARAGFYVVVTDDREEFANAQRFPGADEILVEDFRSVVDRLTLDADDYVLATTRGHAFDAAIIELTAASAARYVGMLGSKRKQEVIWRALQSNGVPRAALDRVRVPIGEPIGADTPAEIAVSVVAELIRVRRLGDPIEQRP